MEAVTVMWSAKPGKFMEFQNADSVGTLLQYLMISSVEEKAASESQLP